MLHRCPLGPLPPLHHRLLQQTSHLLWTPVGRPQQAPLLPLPLPQVQNPPLEAPVRRRQQLPAAHFPLHLGQASQLQQALGQAPHLHLAIHRPAQLCQNLGPLVRQLHPHSCHQSSPSPRPHQQHPAWVQQLLLHPVNLPLALALLVPVNLPLALLVPVNLPLALLVLVNLPWALLVPVNLPLALVLLVPIYLPLALLVPVNLPLALVLLVPVNLPLALVLLVPVNLPLALALLVRVHLPLVQATLPLDLACLPLGQAQLPLDPVNLPLAHHCLPPVLVSLGLLLQPQLPLAQANQLHSARQPLHHPRLQVHLCSLLHVTPLSSAAGSTSAVACAHLQMFAQLLSS